MDHGWRMNTTSTCFLRDAVACALSSSVVRTVVRLEHGRRSTEVEASDPRSIAMKLLSAGTEPSCADESVLSPRSQI